MENRLSELRRSRSWTLEYTAQLVGITKSALGNIEHGRRQPSLEVIIRLQHLFLMPIDFLLEVPEESISQKDVQE